MLKENDVLCAFGDSMTASGFWTAEVFESLAKYGIKVYNCGVAGDTAYDSMRRIYGDCLCYSPDYVTVMFGINDIGRDLYPYINDNPKKLEKTEFYMKRHKEYMEKVINTIEDFGAEVIVLTPPPYMEGTGFSSDDLNCSSAINECAENARNLAKKFGCRLVDVNAAFNQISDQKKIISNDRIHPTLAGYHIIAQMFLKSIGLIDEMDGNDEFEFSQINKERMEADGYYKKLMYGEHDIVGKYCDENNIKLSFEEKRKCALRKKDDPIKYIAECAKLYYDHAADIYDAKSEMIKKTAEMVSKLKNNGVNI